MTPAPGDFNASTSCFSPARSHSGVRLRKGHGHALGVAPGLIQEALVVKAALRDRERPFFAVTPNPAVGAGVLYD